MWYDADIDALMARTALRLILLGRVSRSEALIFGLASPITLCSGVRSGHQLRTELLAAR